MTPEAQRIAIAEFEGWSRGLPIWDGEWVWKNPDGSMRGQICIPDYLHDLNAMHEAEKILGGPTDYRWCGYMTYLQDVCAEGSRVSSTAAQRAEALLRTIGKWVAEPSTESL